MEELGLTQNAGRSSASKSERCAEKDVYPPIIYGRGIQPISITLDAGDPTASSPQSHLRT